MRTGMRTLGGTRRETNEGAVACCGFVYILFLAVTVWILMLSLTAKHVRS